jgi:Leucine-rich repeat (LRR) protein
MDNNVEEYINSLPNNTTVIDISSKNLTYIPDLSRFTCLTRLYCYSNCLTELPPLTKTPSLRLLDCSRNQLTRLPELELHPNLRILYCSYNDLTQIPALNEELEILSCYNNRLTKLPRLNNKLEYLECQNNLLTYLPFLNKSLTRFICFNNPFIIYPEINYHLEINTVNIINIFRLQYYTTKYKKRIFYAILKKRMNRIREELLEMTARIILNPERILFLLENNLITLENDSLLELL